MDEQERERALAGLLGVATWAGVLVILFAIGVRPLGRAVTYATGYECVYVLGAIAWLGWRRARRRG